MGIQHGKYSTYQNHSCRCDECKAAWREYIRDVRARRIARGIPESVVHNANTYNNWGCRCQVCRDDHNADRVARYHGHHSIRADAWTPEEIALLALPTLTARQIAEMTGRTMKAVEFKRAQVRNIRNNALAAEIIAAHPEGTPS